jgi:hypothetical protein
VQQAKWGVATAQEVSACVGRPMFDSPTQSCCCCSCCRPVQLCASQALANPMQAGRAKGRPAARCCLLVRLLVVGAVLTSAGGRNPPAASCCGVLCSLKQSVPPADTCSRATSSSRPYVNPTAYKATQQLLLLLPVCLGHHKPFKQVEKHQTGAIRAQQRLQRLQRWSPG